MCYHCFQVITGMEKALEYIIRKFPDHAALTIDLFCADEDFRILCEDYLTSVRTVEEYRTKTLIDGSFENEYLQISIELEKEILQNLQNRTA